MNYMPGMAGFMQSLIFGYAGVRIRPEFLEFHNPIPPPNCRSIKLLGFNYLGAEMDIDIRNTPDIVEITLKSLGEFQLVLLRNDTGEQVPLQIGK